MACKGGSCRPAVILGVVIVLSFFGKARGDVQPPDKQIAGTIIQVARSQDGLEFSETGEVLLGRVSAPSLVRLRSGELLLFVSFLPEKASRDDETVLAVTRSDDQGKSWSRLRPVRFRGKGAARIHSCPVHAEAFGERVRLYLAASEGPSRGASRNSGSVATWVRSATSKDGLIFHLEGSPLLRYVEQVLLHPMGIWFGNRFHLFLGRLSSPESNASASGIRGGAHHAVSRDGQRFARVASVRPADIDFVGSIVVTESGLRAYVSDRDGVRSAVSRNGNDWKLEEGHRVQPGWNPAVTKLSDGTFFMVYCVARDEAKRPASFLVTVDENVDWRHRTEASDDENVIVESFVDPLGSGIQADDEAIDVELSALENSEAEQTEKTADGADVFPGWSEEDTVLPVEFDEFGFAPQPDFRRKVDYYQWMRRLTPAPEADNAFDAYAELFPVEPGGTEPKLPQFHNLFQDPDYDGPPMPWNPEEHPEWEKSNREVKNLLERYRAASRLEGFARPIDTSDESMAGFPDGAHLLLGMLLPDLSPHRAFAKAILAEAWRAEGGNVSADGMLESWKTVARNARHLQSGTTLIEDLVAQAQRQLMQGSARWALKYGAIPEARWPEALATLRQYDRNDEDPVHGLRGEHAFSMDITQYLFSPPDRLGQPRLNHERAEALTKANFTGSETSPDFTELTAEDARESVDAFDAYYRELGAQMQIGYPQVRASDLDAMTDHYIETNAMTEIFLPALSRVHHLRARQEAGRRATQLAYATHIFHAREGRWPATLDELPGEFGDTMRIDPFTGQSFGYRLTPDGPTIYSASENGIDDGGIHSPTWSNRVNPSESDDFVFWPPQP